MSQKPISQIYHKPDNMAEEVDYTLREMKEATIAIDKKLEEKTSIADLNIVLATLSSQYADKAEVLSALDLLSTQVEKLTAAIQALADKLDNEDVTNLDNNYRSAVDDEIN